MTIYERICKDHAHHRELLNRIAQTSGDSEDRREAWDAFYYDVKAHAAAEEETFYSKLMADSDGQDDARHSVSEHKEMDDIIEELQSTEFSSPAWLQAPPGYSVSKRSSTITSITWMRKKMTYLKRLGRFLTNSRQALSGNNFPSVKRLS